ncbi:hypothetical protein FQN55_004717 [Onygenales sp. PD_40]|nr:hypothetical protein FQN55_004717 [Onygenales sp. PD_40]KAK2788595.1 hypothetical protein FQN53_003447 [Emmonsiellopsis sp. PD_33]
MSGTPFTVKALYEYTSEHDDDLNFPIDQIIKVTAEEDEDWYLGEYMDESGSKKEGIFPRNFVERYEPPAPPRPTRPSRPRREPEPAPPAEPVPAPASPEVIPEPIQPEPEPTPITQKGADIQPPPVPEHVEVDPVPAAAPAAPPSPPPTEAQEPVPKPVKKAPPPAVADKPTGSSFKDRIAAFNKPAAAPITPYDPNKPASSASFIKKPFVAPPPSRNAYVPPPTEAAQKIYRREEDPDIVERASQDRPAMERPVISADTPEETEDQPKPTSLKERIALLQKQQLEQAARHAEAAQKKEKPKKPPKKRLESQEQVQQAEPAQGAELEKTDTAETAKQATAEDEHRQRSPPGATTPPQPSRELTSDTNDADNSGAGDTEADEASTGKEDADDQPREPRARVPSKQDHPVEADVGDEEDEEEREEEEEEEMDPEIRRRMEIRERMAKMSGGMGMMGMFGPPGGLPPPSGGFKKSKPLAEPERKASTDDHPHSPPATHAPPVPLMALPGMHTKKAPEPVQTPSEADDKDEQQPTPVERNNEVPTEEPSPRPSTDRAPPPPPPTQARAAPVPPANLTRPVPPPIPVDQSAPPVPAESRPPVVPGTTHSPSIGEESDDELSAAQGIGQKYSDNSHDLSDRIETPRSPEQTFSGESSRAVKSPTLAAERRASRGPPPIPLASPTMTSPVHTRPPPPPPPGRTSTSDSRMSISTPTGHSDNHSEDEVTEYDGDYDTDIASGVKHKDALKAHGRDSSLDDGTITDEFSAQSPRSPHEVRPPIPSTGPPRSVPPPPPSQPPRNTRRSADMPRAPPPPIPPPKEQPVNEADDSDDYDPFRYSARPPVPSNAPPRVELNLPIRTPAEDDDDDLYSATLSHPPFQQSTLSAGDRPAPGPPPPPSQAPAPPPPGRSAPRQSMDALRATPNTRRSVDMSRPSMDQRFIAGDVDLGPGSLWWTQPNMPPPVFQKRNDILFEMDQATPTNRGADTTVSKTVYVLFRDYSQTIITVRFDAKNPVDAVLEQRHEPPPQRLRQDQLESAHEQFGTRISDAVTSKQNTVVGDGTPHGLIHSLLAPLSDALLPIGTRAYGSEVYANLANASVQQVDEIRAGDIVTFRNARFQGHKGTMHQKYTAEVGKPDHVGVVVDWDGTKKKIRAWEQGRESRKVKVESFKLGDLRSGECRVWRVMPRGWVGWGEGGERY